MKPFYDISNHNGFEDLMDTTHHTGNAWLDKKLNNNTAYILGALAIGAIGSALGGKDKGPQPYGGGFNPATKPFMERGLKDLTSAYDNGARSYEGPRVAGFDAAQQQAQASLMALSTAQPDYFQTATAGLGEAIDLQRQAGAAITPELLAQQRQMLAPTIDAERQAADIAFRESLRDIGVGAGGAGVGALTGARADIMRGGAAGERAMTEAALQGRLTDQALGTLESQFGRQAGAAAGLGALTGQALGIGQEGTQDALNRANLAMGVGEQRQGLQQQFINIDREKFAEQDPFARAQQYLATVGGLPTQQTQYYQPQSQTQQALGIASMFTGKAEGGPVFSKEEEDEMRDIEDFSDANYGTKYSMLSKLSDMGGKKDGKMLAAMSQPARLETIIDESAERKKQLNRQLVQSQLAEREAKMGQLRPPAFKQEGGEVVEDKGILSRIIGGVKSGLSSLNSFDPFEGYSRAERMQVGLSILGATPQIGESALGATARGASTGIKAIEDNRAVKAAAAAKAAKANELNNANLNIIMKVAATKFNYTINEETGQLQNVNGKPLSSDAAEAVSQYTANLVQAFIDAGGGQAGLTAVTQFTPPSLGVDTPAPDVDSTNSPLRKIFDTAEEATKLN